MEHYRRAELLEQPLELSQLPFRSLPDDLIWMKVKATSRVGNMVGYVKTQLKTHDHVLWSGSGQAVCKVMLSAELLKKAAGRELHQETHCCYHRSTEVWKPKENDSLDTLKVNKDIPSIHILLSKTPFNPDSPSYQPPHHSAPFWSVPSEETTPQTRKPSRATPTAPSGDTSLKKKRRRGPPTAR